MNSSGVELMSVEALQFQVDECLARYRLLTADPAVGDTKTIWSEHINTTQKSIFFCRAVLRTIEALQSKDYISFDAHTTSNCCQGIAVLARDFILSSAEINFDELQEFLEDQVKALQNGDSRNFDEIAECLPEQLFILTGMYVLAFVRTFNEEKRMRTDARKLKLISEVGANFCWDLTNALKLHFSNLVANSYRLYGEELNPMTDLNGIPVHKWNKYVQKEHLRVDKREVQYASCIFSTQVCLAYLISSRGKVAMVNDIINSSGEFVDRLIWVFQGDGCSKLELLSLDEISQLTVSQSEEPVVVFGGYVCSDTLNKSTLSRRMDLWQEHFPSLMTACDTFYPQFPAVTDDPDFNDDPIIPSESEFRKALLSHSEVAGVSRKDPSLFCSSHTYTASLSQIAHALNHNDPSALPSSFHGMQITHDEVWGERIREALAQ